MRAKFGHGPTVVSKSHTHPTKPHHHTSSSLPTHIDNRLNPPGLGWVQFFLGESKSRLYPHMRAKFGRGPTAVSKKLSFKFISRFHRVVLFIYYVIFSQEYPIRVQHCSPRGLLHYMHDKTNINQHTFSYITVTTLTTWYMHANYVYMFLIISYSYELVGNKWIIILCYFNMVSLILCVEKRPIWR